LIKEVKSQLIRLIIREPKTAVQNPRTSNPDIRPEAIFNNRALMTNVKRPRLKILMGSVIMKSMGRKSAFSIPSAAAAKKAEKKLST
jgi:hypothetical protein